MAAITQRLKVLMIASGCDGTDVGEAWSSFQWVNRTSQRHDVTLLTFRKRDKSSAVQQLPGARVVEWIDLPLVGRWERFNSMLKPGYVSFYMSARRWLKERLRAGETFDLVHQISPLALRYPSPATDLGVPLIIGPLAGSVDNPGAFQSELNAVPWYTKLRALDEWRLAHDPVLRHSYSSADRIICVAPYVKRLLGNLPSSDVEFMSETGVVELPAPRPAQNGSAKAGLRLLFVGRVIRTKGVRDAIRAVAKLEDLPGLTFDVVGWGNDLDACKEEAQKLGLRDKVTFHGRQPRSAVDAFYDQADIFVFPSFREPSGNAVIEAMSHGLAMIAAERGGPGFVVDDECGVRVPVTDPEDFASRIAAAIRQLAQTPERIAAMGAASREKIKKQFLWEAKIERMEQIYFSVLAASHSGTVQRVSAAVA